MASEHESCQTLRTSDRRTDSLIVPIITIYEVVKKILREEGEEVASRAKEVMQQGQVIPVDVLLGSIALQYRLPLADSLIYADCSTSRRDASDAG